MLGINRLQAARTCSCFSASVFRIASTSFSTSAGQTGCQGIKSSSVIVVSGPMARSTAGMADIALMPERHIFHGRERTDMRSEAGKAGEVFGQLTRIALVRHGRRALLAGREERLPELPRTSVRCMMADFGGDVFDRAKLPDHRQRRERRIAWRSRGTTWVAMVSGTSPKRAHTAASTAGSILA